MKWVGKLYVDKALPFGLRSAPKIFKAVADAMQWILELSRTAKELHHRVRLNRGFRSDLCWWACSLPGLNGTSMMAGVVKSSSQYVFYV